MDTIRTRVAQLMSGAAGTAPSAIETKYAQLGGAAGFLGAATSAEGPAQNGGRYRHYRGGSIYASSATGAHVLTGAIRDEFARLGWEGSLGFPLHDESPAARGGRYLHLQKGSLYFSPATGARDVRGDIRDKWQALGWENGWLGYPTQGHTRTPNGRGGFTHFEGGSIYWSAATGARAVRGAIRDAWARTGWENGPLGFPTTDDTRVPSGKGTYTHFEGGSIYWSSATGAHVVRNAIRDRWASLGWENSYLGFPTSDEYEVPGGRRSDFSGGSITWNRSTGQTTVQRR
uniref:LGFP repeat-containing protein n=1 Tax=Kineococcus sp. G2 TaxID=3127484 RepID=UPI003FA57756